MINHLEKENKPIYKRWWAILIMIIIVIIVSAFDIVCITVVPQILILEIIVLGLIYLLIKKSKKTKKEKEEYIRLENELTMQGYKKVSKEFYINDKELKINLLGKEYEFSQIVDCKLIENDNSISSTYGNTRGKINYKGKIKSNSISFVSNANYCGDLYINITVDDFENPNIILNLREKGLLLKASDKYKNNIKIANNALATLKLIIAKNNKNMLRN